MWLKFKDDCLEENMINIGQVALISFRQDAIQLTFQTGEFEAIRREYNENFDEIVRKLIDL